MPALEIASSPVYFAVTDAAPNTADLGKWRIVEQYEPEARYFNQRWYGSYRLLMTREVETEQAGSEYIAGCYIAHAINRAFVFSTGRPLTRVGYGLFLRPTNPPLSWTSNASGVLPEDDWASLQAHSEWIPHFRVLPRLPLKDALVVLDTLGSADPILNQLIFYHGIAVTTIEPDLNLLAFAQGLKIVRELLAGRSAADKQAKLPVALATKLRGDLNWLFAMAQQRRETRHSIDKKGTIQIKPSFEPDEEDDYVHDAELVLRAVICLQLELPLATATREGGVSVEELVEP